METKDAAEIGAEVPSSPGGGGPLAQFAARRRSLAAACDGLADVVAGVDALEEAARTLRTRASRLREGVFRVVVVGVFSTGKSTLLNAMLGRAVLPSKVNPCTAVATALAYGPAPRVSLARRDGGVSEMSLADFADAVQLGEVESGDRFEDIALATVEVPLPLLQDGVILVDTPGLDDDDARTARTMAALDDADAGIVVLNAARFLTSLEREALRRHLLPRGLVNLFFPVTMVDRLAEVAADAAGARLRMQALADEALAPLCPASSGLAGRFFPLDARGALRARTDGDVASEVASGLPAFEEALADFLISERGAVQVELVRFAAERLVEDADRIGAITVALAGDAADAARARVEAAAPQRDALASVAARVGARVAAFRADQVAASVAALQAFTASLVSAVGGVIDAADLGGGAPAEALSPAGRTRVAERLVRAVEAWLRSRTAAFQAEEAARWSAALDGLREEVRTEVAAFDAARDGLDVAMGASIDVGGGASPERDDRIDPRERWFAVALGAVMVSPGAMAAGYHEGFPGALKGVAGRLAARLVVLGLGAAVGPVGWAGLAVYAASDVALAWASGEAQVRQLRDTFAADLRERLLVEGPARESALRAAVVEALAPLDAVAAAASEEARRAEEGLMRLLDDRERAVVDAGAVVADWSRRRAAIVAALAEVRAC